MGKMEWVVVIVGVGLVVIMLGGVAIWKSHDSISPTVETPDGTAVATSTPPLPQPKLETKQVEQPKPVRKPVDVVAQPTAKEIENVGAKHQAVSAPATEVATAPVALVAPRPLVAPKVAVVPSQLLVREETPKEMLERFRPYAKSIESRLAKIIPTTENTTVTASLERVDLKKTDSLISPIVAVAEYHFRETGTDMDLYLSFNRILRFAPEGKGWTLVGGTSEITFPSELKKGAAELNGGIITETNDALK